MEDALARQVVHVVKLAVTQEAERRTYRGARERHHRTWADTRKDKT